VLAGTAGAGDVVGVRVGPGPVVQAISHGPYRVEVRISPNAGGLRTNTFSVRTTRAGRPVGAAVSARFTMPAMGMPPLGLRLQETGEGVARGAGRKLTMTGRWHVALHIVPRDAPAFDVLLIDDVLL
jgi:hypothetical protein